MMNPEDTGESAIPAALAEWRKKYDVKDGDPLLALVELFRIHFGNVQSTAQSAASYIPSFVEFRDSLELLDQCGKRFSNQATDLIEAMRGVPNIGKQVRSLIFLLATLCALVLGILIGLFLSMR